jgi:hypothetical protein
MLPPPSDLNALVALTPDDKAVQALQKRLNKAMRASEKHSVFADMFK